MKVERSLPNQDVVSSSCWSALAQKAVADVLKCAGKRLIDAHNVQGLHLGKMAVHDCSESPGRRLCLLLTSCSHISRSPLAFLPSSLRLTFARVPYIASQCVAGRQRTVDAIMSFSKAAAVKSMCRKESKDTGMT